MELFHIDHEIAASLHGMDDEELRSFAELQENPASNEQIELYIYTRFFIFKRTSSTEHLEQAILRTEGWIAETAVDNPDRARRFDILDMMSTLMSQHRLILKDVIQALPVIRRRFERTDSIDDLNRAVDVAGQAVDITPQDHLDRAAILYNLGNRLRKRFERTGSIDDLNRAVDVATQLVDATSQDHPDRAIRLNNLGNWFCMRFERTGSIDDLNRAVDIADQVINVTPQGHPYQAGYLNNLGNWLGIRFELTGSINDLNRAVDITGQTADVTPQDHPDRAIRLNNLGNWLSTRFEQTGSINDLNRAIDVAGQAINATPQNHPERASRLNNLANWLGMRFEQTGSMDDLNRAVDVAGQAANAVRQDYYDRAIYLNNLGNRLVTRFEQTGSINDLNRAIDVASQAVNATPQGHRYQPGYLNNLGYNLGTRFERTGSIDDLNRAVDVAGQAVDAMPQDHPDRIVSLNNLGKWLGKRFEQTGSINDLNRAVDITGQAADATPQNHDDRAIRLNNLGIWLGIRFERTGSIDDLNRAIDVAGQAVDATPQDHPDRGGYLSNFGNNLSIRFERFDSIDDIDRAVDITSQAVNVTPQGHRYRAGYLNNLGNNLGTRFERTGSIDDLNRAVDVAGQAVDATPQDHPDRAGRLNNFGNRLGTRFEQTGSVDDLNRALSSYREGWRCYTAPPSIRIPSALQAARILALQKDWEGSSQLLQEAVNLLPTVSPRSLKHTDKQHMLADSAGLASMAAAISLNAGKDAFHALQLLELGRGVIAGLLMDMRGDISDLKRKYPGLADEFVSLRDELDSPEERLTSQSSGDNVSLWELQAKRRREADQKFSELITRIRAQPSFDRFLLPPTADELMAAANPDPVIVVNLSSYRCDAFLVERDRIRVLELPGLTVAEVQKRALGLRLCRVTSSSQIAPLLEWLWNTVARPSLDALGFKDPVSDNNWPRVWWVPTGLLSQLPLHAAGYHTSGCSETVLDRVMSSYASSVKALIHGRRRICRPTKPLSDYALLVAMRETPDLSANRTLPFVAEEVGMVKKLCPSLQLLSIAPILRKNDVLRRLQTCRIFHFAGHGRSDPAEPSRSCLLLEDWKTNPLTVGDLRDHRLQENAPFLGYLSACSTGANEAEQLADESIHLVSAFQLAGFRHVVGTLWEVSDKHCVDVARVLYETLGVEGMTDAAVCRGLHRAVRALRDGEIKVGEARNANLAGSENATAGNAKSVDSEKGAGAVGDAKMNARRCLEDLLLTDPRDDRTRIEQTKGGLLRDSYKWILGHNGFRRWRDDRHSRLLWIRGDAGKGKTMLLCGIIDELQQSPQGLGAEASVGDGLGGMVNKLSRKLKKLSFSPVPSRSLSPSVKAPTPGSIMPQPSCEA
ncbi:hypothetical protein DL768_008055 [Monosporascus sp. mg162]|nr:hypothetical protein DL768_008055 [Monosporascus sp. mg162]